MSDEQVLRLRDELSEACEAHEGKLHLLVDTALEDPCADWEKRPYAQILKIRHPALRKQERPYLLPLGDFGRDDAIDKSITLAMAQAARTSRDHTRGRSICGWIMFTGNAQIIADRLSRHASQIVDRKRRLFRFWDPRVMDMMEGGLEPRQNAALLAGVTGWWWLGRDLQLKALSSGSEVSGEAAGFALTEAQIRIMRWAEPINRTLDVLQDMGHDVSSPGLDGGVREALSRGERTWALESIGELVQYALCTILVHRSFDEHPEVRTRMREAQSVGCSPLSALDAFEKDDWNRIRQRIADESHRWMDVMEDGHG